MPLGHGGTNAVTGILEEKYGASFVVIQYGYFGCCYFSIYGFYMGEIILVNYLVHLGKFSFTYSWSYIRTAGQKIFSLKDLFG